MQIYLSLVCTINLNISIVKASYLVKSRDKEIHPTHHKVMVVVGKNNFMHRKRSENFNDRKAVQL